MARTEKKFGQLTQPAANTLHEIVPTSSNRRNVLLNVTGRANSFITAITATAPITFNPTSVTTGLASQTGVAITTTGGNPSYYRGIGLNPAKNTFVLIAYNSNQQPGVVGISATGPTSVTTTSASAINYSGQVQWYNADSSFSSNGQLWTASSGSYFLTYPIVVLDDTWAMIYYWGNTGATSDYRTAIFRYNAGGSPTPVGYNASPTSATHQYTGASTWQVAGVWQIRPGTTANGVGMHMWHHAGSGQAIGSSAVGMRIFRGGAQTATAFWATTANSSNQTGTKLANFWQDIEFNAIHNIYAITNPTLTAADSWHGVASSGGTIGTDGILPPAENAKFGFRFVAATSGGTDTAEFLKGAITYPSGTPTTLVPTGVDKPISQMRWSPDGTRLAVMFNRSHSNTVSLSVTSRRIVSNVATLTLNIGNLASHTYVAGDSITVSSVASPFNGTFTVTAVTSNTVSYALTNADIAATSSTGSVSATKTNNLTNSVIAIYTRQNDGSYIETHQSGSTISFSANPLPSGLAWNGESNILAVTGINAGIWLWYFGGTSISRSTVTSASGWTVTAPNPQVTSMTAPTTGANTTITGPTFITPTAQASYLGYNRYPSVVEFLPVAGAVSDLLYIVRDTLGMSDQRDFTSTWQNVNNLGGYSGTATISNYVNTIAQSLPVSSGNVTQLSNIVLESGERLYVEPTVSNAVDAVAYGVEIT
jgi:hypothetical protein